ncbi:hypothetical protein [Marixanthomonas spongiae]|uniref:Uncharacterized protein n=1 Tax=Marixanthomonas spongiae TaxID=2174845 RepID=A0A2U0HYY7_9FLAO|nr:hypothetical protein [Marixanthomonas spongiae]PVW14092.1 hypothetical protein DDV96_09745 [Marixanthomonas spongiae]
MNRILFFLTAVSLGVFLVNCGNEEPQEEPDVLEEHADIRYGNTNYPFPQLTEKARTFTSKWGGFEDFETQVKSINGATVEALKNNSERLVVYTDSIAKKLPDTLAVQAIESRVMVAKTRAHLLDQLVHRTRIDSATLQTYITEMNNAASNLMVQINDKFKKDAIDQQRIDAEKKEIEKQKKIRDSIFQQELKDKNQK